MEFCLCSEAVIDHLRPAQVSTPFMSGYENDDCKYFVAVLDTEDADKYYDEIIWPYNEGTRHEHIDFWYRACGPNHVESDTVTLAGTRRTGLFVEIEQKLSLTKECNRAFVIYNLAEKFNCTPIELINKINKKR